VKIRLALIESCLQKDLRLAGPQAVRIAFDWHGPNIKSAVGRLLPNQALAVSAKGRRSPVAFPLSS
jgi:hypothetical protein